VLFGKAQVVDDVDEKLWAMELMTEGVVSGRWEGSRVPPDKAEMGSTSVVRVRVEGGSAKRRVGGPGDERKDLEREEIIGRVWTGESLCAASGRSGSFEGANFGGRCGSGV